MNSEQIFMYVVALILGMLLADMLKGVCGCKVVEGQFNTPECQSCLSWAEGGGDISGCMQYC